MMTTFSCLSKTPVPFLYLIAGILIGFLMAVPIGAVGILCVRRTLASGLRQGYITGLAGATADMVYCIVSAGGIRLIADFMTDHQHEIRLVGGVVLLLMGILLIRSRRSRAIEQPGLLDDTRVYFSALVVATTNPLVLFSYGAVMAALGVARLDYFSLSLLIAGMVAGSFLWFIFLSNLAHRFRASMNLEKLSIVNRVAGVLLILIGLSAVWNGIWGLP